MEFGYREQDRSAAAVFTPASRTCAAEPAGSTTAPTSASGTAQVTRNIEKGRALIRTHSGAAEDRARKNVADDFEESGGEIIWMMLEESRTACAEAITWPAG